MKQKTSSTFGTDTENDIHVGDVNDKQSEQGKSSAKISVPVFDGLQMLNTDDIVKCIAHECYTEIVLLDGSSIMVSRLLKEYEDILFSFNFLRIHNSHLINLRHVKKYIKGDGGYVVMCNGESCEVSRRKKAELLQRLAVVNL
jgi:two-component system LytT family response regulator